MFKYLSPWLVYAVILIALVSHGFVVWLPLLYIWVFIPLLELFMQPNNNNLSIAEEELAKKNKLYDYLLYIIVPFQFITLGLFLYVISFTMQTTADLVGKTAAMGLACGIFGINVGHELGHRVNKIEQLLAKLLLLSSLYMHFFIEHNKGHHKRVATPEDPASARYGEGLYRFFFRSIVFSYVSAWHIAINDASKKGYKPTSLHNEMLQFHFIQIAFVSSIIIAFGWLTGLLFFAAAFFGILLLETVNYIEHYGLQRQPIAGGKYERAMPAHSWNSNHMVGRLTLFELSRHSDHHYLASRKYQVLRHHDDSPQMPTGYPGMMLLSTIPPVWFKVMNARVKKLNAAA